MAFLPQNGWNLFQPPWGECHEHSMVISGQVCQPPCLEVGLLRSRDLQRAFAAVLCQGTRTVCGLCLENPPQGFHEEVRSPILRGTCRARETTRSQSRAHLLVSHRQVPQGGMGPRTHPRARHFRGTRRDLVHPGNLLLLSARARRKTSALYLSAKAAARALLLFPRSAFWPHARPPPDLAAVHAPGLCQRPRVVGCTK